MKTPEFDLPAGVTWPMVDRYVAGEADAGEVAVVRACLDTHDDFAAVLAGLREAATVPEAIERDVLQHVFATPTDLRDVPTRRPQDQPKPFGPRNRPFAHVFGARTWQRQGAILGAVVALVVAAGVAYWPTSRTHPAQHTARTYTTPAGKRAEFTLRDGTRVILAPQSELTFRDNVASLVGEAFFTVRPNTERPLVVRTGSVTTRVLGTTFSVRRYPAERSTRVVVLEGKVQVGGTQAAILTARSVAEATDSVVTAMTVANPAALTQWTTGQLVFQDAPVDEVLRAVERWYGVTFRVTDTTFTSDRLTTALDARRNRSETLAALEAVLTVRMTMTGDTVTVMPRRGTARPSLLRRNLLLTPSTGHGR